MSRNRHFRLTLSLQVIVFNHPHRVSYGDCTVGDHVYYSRYLDFLEIARGEFFRFLTIPSSQLQQRDLIFPVVECHLKYRSAARYDDLLQIEVWPALVERVRLNFGHRILKQTGQLVLEAHTFHVCTGLDEKPKRMPEELREILGKFLKASDSDGIASSGVKG